MDVLRCRCSDMKKRWMDGLIRGWKDRCLVDVITIMSIVNVACML